MGPAMPESPEIFRVALQVTDIEAAARFYSSLLGIDGRSIRGARYYFDCGPVILALVGPGEGAARPNPDDIYFSVRDLEAVHARATQLECLAQGEVHGAPAGSIVVSLGASAASTPWIRMATSCASLNWAPNSLVGACDRAAAELRR